MKNKKVLLTISMIVGMVTGTMILSSFVTLGQDSKTEFSKTEIGDSNLILVNEDSYCAADKIPEGCYEGSSRSKRGRCAILISSNTLHIMDREGKVLGRWNIESDKDGVLILKSEYGAGARASWWTNDGNVYLEFQYQTYTLMND